MVAMLNLKVTSRDSKLSWLALVASVLLLFTSFGFLRTFGIFYHAFLDEFKESKEKTAWVSSIPFTLLCILAPVAMWLHGRFGLRLCIVAATFPLALSLLITSFARNVDELFLTFSIPFGIAACTIIIGSNRCAYIYFDKSVSMAYGLQTGGCSISEIGLSYLIIYLLNSVGLKNTLRVLAIVFFCICLLSSRLLFPTDYQHEEQAYSQKKNGIRSYLHLFRNKRFCLFIFSSVVFNLVYSVSSVHQVQLAVEYGASESFARQFPVFTAVAGALGRLSAGWVYDAKILKTFNFFQATLFAHALISFLGSFASSKTHLVIYIWATAFVEGQINLGGTSVIREIVGLHKLSEGFAVVMCSISVSVMLGPPFIGFLVDQTDDYRVFFYVAGIPSLLAMLIFIPVRFIKSNEEIKDYATEALNNNEEDEKNGGEETWMTELWMTDCKETSL